MNVEEYLVEERARTRIGSTLKEKYKLDRLLGVGGMAAVYAATHRNNKRFAVKVLHAELSLHVDTRTRFLREGYVANSVGHPGAVAVLDDDVADDDAAFLVMELLDGASLDVIAAAHDRKIEPRAVLAIAIELLDVLAAADARSIVHRDIKPANLFVTRDGALKVLDFGVARLRTADGQSSTLSGAALGTPAYMAPEQALGHSDQISGRTDVWAAGATMFALVAGRAVHSARSAPEQMVFAATKPAPPLAEVVPDAPASICAIVDRALAFAQSDRWPSAAAMRDAAREAYRALYPDDDAQQTLAALVEHVRPSSAKVATTAPAATTAQAGSVSPKAATIEPTPVARTTPSASNASHASLAGTAARPRTIPPARGARNAALVALLVALGVGAGLLIARPSSTPTHGEVSAAASAPRDTSATAPVTATTAAVSPSASASASTSASAEAPPARPSVVAHPPVPPRAAAPSASASSPKATAPAVSRDSFDRQ